MLFLTLVLMLYYVCCRKSFRLVPASPSLCELNEGFSDSFHSPAEKQQEKTLSTPPTLTSLTSFTPSTIEKNVTPPTFSTPPTLKPLLKFQAMPKAVGASSLPPPRRLKSSTVKRSLDFGNTDRKLNEEWLARIMKSRCDQQDMNCPVSLNVCIPWNLFITIVRVCTSFRCELSKI